MWAYILVNLPLCSQVWSARLYEQLGRHVGHVAPVTCLALDGNFLLSGSEDCTVRLWDLLPALRYSQSQASGFHCYSPSLSCLSCCKNIAATEASRGVYLLPLLAWGPLQFS